MGALARRRGGRIACRDQLSDQIMAERSADAHASVPAARLYLSAAVRP
jgi:hypothetical protein